MTTKDHYIEAAQLLMDSVGDMDTQIAGIPDKGGYIGTWRTSQITGDWEQVPVYRSHDEQAAEYITAQNNLIARANVYATLAVALGQPRVPLPAQ